ncbi:DUF4018 domain-containing protein [Peribacillus alkalitolerans]|uniref:DUF4018 domain-containing protein n=1 Tax=Peribacillus alkalitolerans TaxID=1550385 RepID=UPI0013D1B6F9|nr:DUF4018 domain-containing protein [Peribacillus alkalitolerans]
MQLLFNSSIFLLFFLVSMKEEQMIYFFPFFFVSIAAQWLLRKNKATWVRVTFFILQLVILGVLPFSWMQSFVLSLTFYLLYWDSYVKNFHKIWIALSALAYSALNLFSMPRITEIALFILILILVVFVESQSVRVAMNRIGMLGTTILLSAAVYFVLPYGFKALGWLLYSIVHIISLPIGFLVEGLLFAFPKLSIEGNMNEEVGLLKMDKWNDYYKEEAKTDNTIPLIILSIIAVLILIYLYRKIRKRVEDTRNDYTVENSGFLQVTTLGTGLMNKPPTNPIRKAVYKWEKKLKNPFSRQKGEAFSKWIKRVSKTDHEYIQQVYDRVRYGGQSYSTEEAKRFQKELNQLFGEVKKDK